MREGTTFRETLRELPPESLVPVGWVLDLAGKNEPEPIGDYRLEEVGKIVGRTVSNVRSWCNSGQSRPRFAPGKVCFLPGRKTADPFCDSSLLAGENTIIFEPKLGALFLHWVPHPDSNVFGIPGTNDTERS